jgi:hypothetical protein
LRIVVKLVEYEKIGAKNSSDNICGRLQQAAGFDHAIKQLCLEGDAAVKRKLPKHPGYLFIAILLSMVSSLRSLR